MSNIFNNSGRDYLLQIARGLVPGHSIVNKFGNNPNVGTSAVESVWNGGGAYSFPAAAATVDVVSDSAQDVAAGTGLKSVRIIGLDASHEEISEYITLTGTAPVTSANSYLRVFRMHAGASSGSALGSGASYGGANAGIITAKQSANLLAQIDIGLGQTLMAMYTVPAGKTLYVLDFQGSIQGSGTKAVDLHFHTIDFTNQTKRMRDVLSVQNNGSNSFSNGNGTFARSVITEKTDIDINAHVTSNNTSVASIVSGILIDDALGV